MASQIQMVMYEGYLADAPVMQFTPTGKQVTNFRIGSNREYKSADGKKVKETTWIKVTAWGSLGEIVNQYCDKGSWVIVTGILRIGKGGSPNVYPLSDPKAEPPYGASYEVTADKVRILKGKEGAPKSDVSGGDVSGADFESDDIPF